MVGLGTHRQSCSGHWQKVVDFSARWQRLGGRQARHSSGPRQPWTKLMLPGDRWSRPIRNCGNSSRV